MRAGSAVRPSTYGRTLGAKNKKSLLLINDLLIQTGVNPIQKLIEIAESNEASVEQQIRCWQEVAKYSYPKFQALDIRETQEQVITGIRLVDD
ncbi:MAG TPA: hypothetical protein EYQ47_00195 [Cycloclasticus sp.]|jgi:hypothetical protein|nr:hypothetical protein [Cycloclasticus sp.]